MKHNKGKSVRTIRKKKTQPKKNRRFTFLVTTLLLLGIALFFYYRKNSRQDYQSDIMNDIERPLTKDGKLAFISKLTGDTLKTIDIEIADNEVKRTEGLMWRYSLPDTLGMLFIFDHEQPLSFWMKNTYIPLDIIYVNKTFEIVSIAEYNPPLSESPIPSNKPSMYVIEVIGGFCYRNKIKVSDMIKYDRSK